MRDETVLGLPGEVVRKENTRFLGRQASAVEKGLKEITYGLYWTGQDEIRRKGRNNVCYGVRVQIWYRAIDDVVIVPKTVVGWEVP